MHRNYSIVTNVRLNQSYNSGLTRVHSTQVVPPLCISRQEVGPTKTLKLHQFHQGKLTSSSPIVVKGKRLNITYDARSSVGEGRCKEPKMVQSGDIRPLERKKTIVHRKHGGDRYVSRKIIFSAERRLKNGITSNLQGCQTILDEATPYFNEVESMTKNGPIIVMENNNSRPSYEFTTSKKSNKEKEEETIVYLKEDSLPEIVMDQEELSDSEYEIGESVQFECEEMGDSDGEYSVF